MDTQHPRSEFTDVDQSNTPQGYVQCMDFQHSTVFVQMYKQPTRSLLDLQPGLRVLDAGSGTGEDAREIAKLVSPTGQVIGLDFSQTMLDVAQQRNQGMNLPVSFCQGDIHKLPFADNTFDRCYADKTFQHLPYPKQALSELIRVLKPRGRLVVVDPDHDTHVLDTPYPDVTGRFFRFRSDGTQQPGIAHQQYALFREGVIQEMQTRMKVTDSLEGFSQPGDDSWDREGDLPPQPFDLWTRTNVGENLPFPITPLTETHIPKLFGLDAATPEQQTPTFQATRRLYGRLYINEGAIVHTFTETTGLPASFLDKVWGSRPRGKQQASGSFRPLRLLRNLPSLLRQGMSASKQQGPSHTPKEFFAQIDQWVDSFMQQDLSLLDDRALWNQGLPLWRERGAYAWSTKRHLSRSLN